MAVTGDELRDAARLARESVVVGRAVTLARWIGTGRRPVTAGQVLRKADVPAAGAADGPARGVRGGVVSAGRGQRAPAGDGAAGGARRGRRASHRRPVGAGACGAA